MGIFDEIRDAAWQIADPKARAILAAALECTIDQGNHLPIAHPAIAKHYAEEAEASFARCFIPVTTAAALCGVSNDLRLREWASTLPFLMPSLKSIIVIQFEGALYLVLIVIKSLIQWNVHHYVYSKSYSALRYRSSAYLRDGSTDWVLDASYVEKVGETFAVTPLRFLDAFSAASQIPRMTVIDAVHHSDALQSARIKRHVAPLLSYNTVRIPFVGRGMRAVKRVDHGRGSRKALHHVRMFVRFIADFNAPTTRRPVLVTDHWRGDPKIGIRITERHFES